MKTPDPSPKPAADVKAANAKLLADLQRLPGIPLQKRSAALMAAHLLVDKGSAKAYAMSPEELVAYVHDFRRKYPGAWPAFHMGDPMRLVRALKMHGVECDTREGYDLAMTKIIDEPRMGGTPPLVDLATKAAG